MQTPLPKFIAQYFSSYIDRLRVAERMGEYSAYFLNVLIAMENLESRLWRIENLKVTQKIIAEVGRPNQSLKELDGRLIDAWTELRTVDQIAREGFTDISKAIATVDILAKRDNVQYAFQVTHIRTSVEEHAGRLNQIAEAKGIKRRRTGNASGTQAEIRYNYFQPLENLFWDALENKNAKFSSWKEPGIRCLVIVTNQPSLQDHVIRHIACQAICTNVQMLTPLNIDEVVWVIDNGNSAWFKINPEDRTVQCYVDWNDGSTDNLIVERTEVDLCISY